MDSEVSVFSRDLGIHTNVFEVLLTSPAKESHRDSCYYSNHDESAQGNHDVSLLVERFAISVHDLQGFNGAWKYA